MDFQPPADPEPSEPGHSEPSGSADSELDRGIAVRRREGAGPTVVFDADLDGGWKVGGGLNGGYTLAVIGNALRETMRDAGQPDPVTVSAYYLSAAREGPAVVSVDVRRRGGRLSTLAATLSQVVEGEPVDRITVLATYGDLDRVTDEVATTLVEPDLPPLEDCVATTEASPQFLGAAPFVRRFATRLDPATVGWATGRPSGQGRIQGWFALADHRPLDPVALLMVVDALPPVTFDLGMPGWAPTLELTVHVRAKPAPGWVKLVHATRNRAGGFFEEDCEVWDSTGRLVAQARQLALEPKRPS